MIVWSYRAINNRVARRKWLLFISAIITFGILYSLYKVLSGQYIGKTLLSAALFLLFVTLYAVITLGKPRHYAIDGEYIYYKPFKSRLSSEYEVDEENLVIRFRGWRLIRTLYFENLEDLKAVKRYLERMFPR